MAKSKTSSYVLTLKLDITTRDKEVLDKRFEISRKLYNAVLGIGLKRLNTLKERKSYRKIMKELSKLHEVNKTVLAKEKIKKVLYKDLNQLYKEFDINEYGLINAMTPLYKQFNKNIDNKTAQAIASRAWKAVEKYIYSDSQKVNFKRYNELNSVEGKTNASGIKYRDGFIKWNGLNLKAVVKKNDIYASLALSDRVKYSRIKRELVRGKYKYYVQLVLEGIPPTKIDKNTGKIKKSLGKGRVGIDIGTSTIAYSSNTDVKLLELAPEVECIEKKLKLLQRKMDRSRRATNPTKYNEDGTIIKNNYDKWLFSNRYKKLKLKRQELYRKQRKVRKQSHYRQIRDLMKLGDKFYVESMDFKNLQMRSTERKINENGKIKKKRKYGKSLANKAPSMFLTMLEGKLKINGTKLNKINTYTVKASQYNHVSDEYIKKDLSERWNMINGSKIQRDMYSSFLIASVKENLCEIDRELCISKYKRFKELHDLEVKRISSKCGKRISSMGM